MEERAVLIGSVHVLLRTLTVLYPFLTWCAARRQALDVAYLCVMLVLIFHWHAFKNECILSYWEKRALDPTYQMGECPFVHPSEYLMFAKLKSNDHVASWLSGSHRILSILALLIVLYRIEVPGRRPGLVKAVFFLLIALLLSGLAYIKRTGTSDLTGRNNNTEDRCANLHAASKEVAFY
jgi:hypothetical protein